MNLQRAMETEMAEIKRIEAGKCYTKRTDSFIRVQESCH